MPKKLYRSRKSNVISGVCGGLAEYFNTDPVIVRLIFIFVVLLTGVLPGIIVYLVAVLIIPLKNSQ